MIKSQRALPKNPLMRFNRSLDVLSLHFFGHKLVIDPPVAMGSDLMTCCLHSKDGLRVAAWGAGLGLLLAIAASRVLGSVLVGVDGARAPILLGSAALLILIALTACLVPARRAARLDPLSALREE